MHDKSDHFFDLPFDRKQVNLVISGTASAKQLPTENLRLIVNPFYQTKAIQGVYDINPVFSMNATLRWTSSNNHWSVAQQGNNVFNNKIKTTSTQGNQDYGMTMRQNLGFSNSDAHLSLRQLQTETKTTDRHFAHGVLRQRKYFFDLIVLHRIASNSSINSTRCFRIVFAKRKSAT